MNSLPVVTVAPDAGGWRALCSCGWVLRQVRRPVVDLEAEQHRALCARKSKK